MSAKRHVSSLLLAVLITVPLIAQVPSDVDGWTKITWGMTVEQAKTALQGSTVKTVFTPIPEKKSVFRLRVLDVHIGDVKLHASVATAQGSEEVNAVVLLSDSITASQNNRGAEFDTLKQLLIQKYGAPKSEDVRRGVGVVKSVLWTFPSTTIRLTQSEFGSSVGTVAIHYDAVDRKSLDLL